MIETPPQDPHAETGRKIALALERFSRHAGGAEAYAVDLSQALIDRGWEVHLYRRFVGRRADRSDFTRYLGSPHGFRLR